MRRKLAIISLLFIITTVHQDLQSIWRPKNESRWIKLVQAKGVAGLGKAGGDGQGGSDKAGQQVPPEVYKALTYAGSLFLLTLSVPLLLYGLNKLLNKIEDCFGCGPSSAKAKASKKHNNAYQDSLEQQGGEKETDSHDKQTRPVLDKQPHIRQHLHQNQKLHLQLMHQQPKCYNFTPLQEFEDAQCNNPKDNQAISYGAVMAQQYRSSSSPMQPGANACAINISSDLDSMILVNNINKTDLMRKASPNSEITLNTSNKTFPFSQQTQQPFIISSPHL